MKEKVTYDPTITYVDSENGRLRTLIYHNGDVRILEWGETDIEIPAKYFERIIQEYENTKNGVCNGL